MNKQYCDCCTKEIDDNDDYVKWFDECGIVCSECQFIDESFSDFTKRVML